MQAVTDQSVSKKLIYGPRSRLEGLRTLCERERRDTRGRILLTTEMEMVASAKGSPMMLSMFMERVPEVRRLSIPICPFILRRDGECNEP